MLSSPTTNETNLLKKSSSKDEMEKESQPLYTDSKQFPIIQLAQVFWNIPVKSRITDPEGQK